MEFFSGRDDFLIYRSVTFDESAVGARAKVFSVQTHSSDGGHELPVRKIAEKFGRDKSKSAEQDVRKRTHFLLEGRIRLDYHYGESHITHSQEIIDKADKDGNGIGGDDGAGSSLAEDGDPYGRSRTGGGGIGGARGSDTKPYRVDASWKAPTPGWCSLH
jgi:hypothetical protein